MSVQPLTGWLAIETAPQTPDCYHDLPGDARDGLGIATNCDTGEIEYLVWWKYIGNGRSETTHWMRKPAPPAPANRSEGGRNV